MRSCFEHERRHWRLSGHHVPPRGPEAVLTRARIAARIGSGARAKRRRPPRCSAINRVLLPWTFSGHRRSLSRRMYLKLIDGNASEAGQVRGPPSGAGRPARRVLPEAISMWIPKWQRDRARGVDSPVPTQVVSNEEFIPRPQNAQQKQVEHLIGEMADEKVEEAGHGPPRASWPASWAWPPLSWRSNMVYGNHWDVDEAETLEPAADRGEVSQGRILHHRRAGPLHQRPRPRLPQHGVRQNMGFKLKNDAGRLLPSRTSSRRCSSTARRAWSSSPACRARRSTATRDGKVLEGAAHAAARRQILPSWVMSQRKKEINDLAGCQRALCQGNCAPNHYWDTKTNTPGQDRPLRADGARGQDLRHRLLEVVLPHRSRPLAATASSSTTRR